MEAILPLSVGLLSLYGFLFFMIGIFVNPTANYHLPVKHFLEKNGFTVYCVDTRITKNMSGVENL